MKKLAWILLNEEAAYFQGGFFVYLAGEPGFEPRYHPPEGRVLPLYDSPMTQRAVFYHAVYVEARDLFPRHAAGVVFHIHKDEQQFANGLQANKIP